jgi:hypothetical protein
MKWHSQPHKSTRSDKDPKPLPQCFHSTKKRVINLTKAGAAEQGDFVISFGPHLLGVHSFLFFPTLPPSETKFHRLLFSLWGFVSSIVLKRLTLPKWIGLVLHLFAKGSLFNRVHPPRMTSRLFGLTLICPSQMNCTLLLPCSLPREISMRSCSHGRCVRSGARI